MLRIVLDSTVLCDDYLLKRPDARLVRKAAMHGKCVVHISPVVDLEVRRRHREDLKAAMDKVRSTANDLGKLGVADDADTRLRESLPDSHYPEKLDSLFGEEGFIVEDWPDVSAPTLVQRDLDRLRPFRVIAKGSSKKGTIGMRDTLIWLGVLEVATHYPEDEIVFVSDNVNDFGAEGGDAPNHLHPQLIRELESIGAADRVHWVRKIGELVKAHVAALVTEAEAELRALIAESLHGFNAELFQMTWSPTFDARDGGMAPPEIDADLSPQIEDATISSIEGPYDVEFDQLSATGGVARYRCTHRVDVSLSGFAYQWDYDVADDDVWISEGDWNTRMMRVEAVRSVELVTELEIDIALREVTGIELLSSRRLR